MLVSKVCVGILRSRLFSWPNFFCTAPPFNVYYVANSCKNAWQQKCGMIDDYLKYAALFYPVSFSLIFLGKNYQATRKMIPNLFERCVANNSSSDDRREKRKHWLCGRLIYSPKNDRDVQRSQTFDNFRSCCQK